MMTHKILIVDDEPDNIRAIRNCLAESIEPYTLYQALNGELAIKIASAELPDLIITDWEMPGIDGIELIKRLKHDETTSDIPVIMCTGVMTSSENLHTALTAGAVDFVRKPVDKIELIARVKSMLQLSDSKKELKQKYLLIEQKNSFISALMESIPHPMVYYGLDGKIEGFNRHFESLTGSHITGTRLYDHDYFNIKSIHYKQDHTLINEQVNISYECELAERTYIFSKTLFYSSPSHPLGIMCIMTDITDLKQAHKAILENKERELASNALRLIHYSELNDKLIENLKKIIDFTNEKGNELIRSVISQVNLNTGTNVWQEFETRFENVYESFYQTLNNQFPDLTSKERKLCAFLRMNLSTKDIAALTFQDPKSVDMARYRLRKKLNLNTEENLTDFLMKVN